MGLRNLAEIGLDVKSVRILDHALFLDDKNEKCS